MTLHLATQHTLDRLARRFLCVVRLTAANDGHFASNDNRDGAA